MTGIIILDLISKHHPFAHGTEGEEVETTQVFVPKTTMMATVVVAHPLGDMINILGASMIMTIMTIEIGVNHITEMGVSHLIIIPPQIGHLPP